MTVIMSFVIIMIFFVIMIIMIFFMVMIVFVIMIAMIFFMVMIVFVIMIVMIFFMVIAVIINVNLAVKVFCFSPNQRRSDSSLDREGATIAEAPLKNATKQTIDGVMPWVIFEVVVETSMALNGQDGREVEFTGFKTLSSTTMGAVGLGR